MMAPMKLRRELTFDASPADVLAMLTDPTYWDKVAVATSAISSATTVSTEGDATRVVVDQQQEVAGVPSFAKKFVGDSTQAIKTQVWRGASSTFEVETPGKPTHISGTASVDAQGAGSVLTYDLEVKASVPLIGGKLEKVVVDLTGEGFEKEQSIGSAWLAGER
jgi:carbon monoxide dehydrogenase subunit G